MFIHDGSNQEPDPVGRLLEVTSHISSPHFVQHRKHTSSEIIRWLKECLLTGPDDRRYHRRLSGYVGRSVVADSAQLN